MYAHQVIEDIKTRYSDTPFNPIYSLEKIIHEIVVSQKFHFGNSYGLDKIFKLEGQLAFKEMPEYLRFPYKKCWFDYRVFDESISNSINAFRGFLILSDEKNRNTINVLSFLKDTKSLWGMSDVVQILEIGEGMASRMLIYPALKSEINEDYYLWSDLSLLERSIRLLNCKNIVTEKIVVPEKLNKKRQRLGKQELFDYHILNVMRPSKVQGYSEKGEPTSHYRLHLCRGHLKTYTLEHPLFGKFTGQYWWQAQVRGNKKLGVVAKDYVVKRNTKGDKLNAKY